MTIVRENGDVVCRRCTAAERPFSRMKGLLGRRDLGSDEGLLLRPASSIHTWFMRFAIDAVFLDADLAVVATRSDLPPWRTARARGARVVLELPPGTSARHGLRPGDRLAVSDQSEGRA